MSDLDLTSKKAFIELGQLLSQSVNGVKDIKKEEQTVVEDKNKVEQAISFSKSLTKKAAVELGDLTSKAVTVEEDNNDIEQTIISFPNITSWVSEKIALQHKNTKVQSITYFISNYAILETAHCVLGVGSGFVKLDWNGFTLAQIMQIVQRIEAKVDKMLKEPLNSAIDFFNAAMREIQNECFDDAYNSLDKVIDKATEAFHYASGHNVDIKNFQESVKAIQLLVFARISRYSYDKDNKCFLPFVSLPINIVKLVADSLEDLVNKSLNQKKNVKKSILSRTEDKGKIQDVLDQVLKICYSYISQARGWTNMITKINPNKKQFTIKVMPQFLPEGEEDAAKVIVGVKTGDDQPSSVLLWRTATHVYSMFGNIVAMKKFSSETDSLNIDIMNDNCSVVISSHGQAAIHQGHRLGQYFLCDAEKNIYKQFNTEHGHRPAYIYYYSMPLIGGWRVSDVPGAEACGLLNDSSSATVPETGWKYDYGKSDDTSLVVTGGPLSLCGDVTITGDVADKYPQYTGVFHVTDRMFYGKPVFVNDHGKILYSGGYMEGIARWYIGDKIGRGVAIRSTGSPNSPGDTRATLPWQFWDGDNWRGCKASVICSVHKK